MVGRESELMVYHRTESMCWVNIQKNTKRTRNNSVLFYTKYYENSVFLGYSIDSIYHVKSLRNRDSFFPSSGRFW